jgi:hypothetical protein
MVWGCTFGPGPKQFGPMGNSAHIVTRSTRIDGELLATTDTSLILLQPTGVTEVHYRVIVQGWFNPSAPELSNSQVPDPGSLARLRAASRFPQGMSPELLQRFLEANRLVGHLQVIQ